MTLVEAEDVTADVEDAVLALDFGDLNARRPAALARCQAHRGRLGAAGGGPPFLGAGLTAAIAEWAELIGRAARR